MEKDSLCVVLKVHTFLARWLSWLERRPVTAEVESSSLFWVVDIIYLISRLFFWIWDHSSAGRASALQAEGHRFEPYWSHFARKFFKVENIEREMWRALRAMHTALKSWHKNILYGGIAQLARARGSYPRCRWFKSSSRYYKKESLCGASFCVISILSFMKTLNIICHIPTFILKL